MSDFLVALMAQLVWRHSCGADRLPVVVRFPAGPRVRLKYRRPAERKRARTKEKKLEVTHLMAVLSDGTIVGSHSRWSKNRAYFKILSSSSELVFLVWWWLCRIFASLRFDDAVHVKPHELILTDEGLFGVAWQTKVERKRRGTKFVVPMSASLTLDGCLLVGAFSGWSLSTETTGCGI